MDGIAEFEFVHGPNTRGSIEHGGRDGNSKNIRLSEEGIECSQFGGVSHHDWFNAALQANEIARRNQVASRGNLRQII